MMAREATKAKHTYHNKKLPPRFQLSDKVYIASEANSTVFVPVDLAMCGLCRLRDLFVVGLLAGKWVVSSAFVVLGGERVGLML